MEKEEIDYYLGYIVGFIISITIFWNVSDWIKSINKYWGLGFDLICLLLVGIWLLYTKRKDKEMDTINAG